MQPAILFDLGNTLAAYYHADEFAPILQRSVDAVLAELATLGLATVPRELALRSALQENREAPDHRFRPMAGRLERIFGIPLGESAALRDRLCEAFLDPIFAVGRVYEDSVPSLAKLRAEGYRTAIVSNAPWGSPPGLWHAELGRLGLAGLVDGVVLCGDVGWRKPASAIFERAAAALDCPAGACVFVGDDLRWDVAGSEAAGMRAVLIDRDRRHPGFPGPRIENLAALFEVLDRSASPL